MMFCHLFPCRVDLGSLGRFFCREGVLFRIVMAVITGEKVIDAPFISLACWDNKVYGWCG